MGHVLRALRCYRATARSYHQRHAEWEALSEYAWPVPLRVAGYATGLAAVAGVLVQIGWGTRAALAMLLGAVFLVGFHKLARPLMLTTRTMRMAVFAVQLVAVLIELHLAVGNGSILLLYVLAAELQFILSFRLAVLATAALWLLLLLDVNLFQPTFLTSAFVTQCITTPAGFIFVVAFTRSAVIELVQRRRATTLLAELNEAHTQLQASASQIEALSISRERNRMAGEIHDTLGHYLTVINIQLESAQKLSGRDLARSRESLATAKQLATECLEEVRRSVAALRPGPLDGAGLAEALTRLAEELRNSTGARIHLEADGAETLPPLLEDVAYRVVQEALTNVRKHARAANVWLRLCWEAERFTVTVRDDGVGAPWFRHNPPPHSAFGLAGMQQRVVEVGGTVQCHNLPSGGFKVELCLPRCALPLGRDSLEAAAHAASR